ncbi:MAG TPA: hypothetical protein DSN98_08705 [Thermoplasmata archaeon]|jgi:hypothetical protein|nr:MAG TPA: hypothetical protein DSN98_08705 [Thermoplasmata archaeon]
MPTFPNIASKESIDAVVKVHRNFQRIKREKLAAIDHDQWIHWSKGIAPEIEELRKTLWAYVDCAYSNVPDEKSKEIFENVNASELLVRTQERLRRWEILQNTPYAELSEEQKNDDRVWADKELAVIVDD